MISDHLCKMFRFLLQGRGSTSHPFLQTGIVASGQAKDLWPSQNTSRYIIIHNSYLNNYKYLKSDQTLVEYRKAELLAKSWQNQNQQKYLNIKMIVHIIVRKILRLWAVNISDLVGLVTSWASSNNHRSFSPISSPCVGP